MRSAIGLAALTAGAILTFAVSARVPGIDLRVTGVIIMLAAIAGLVAPTQAGAWLRRRAWLHVPQGAAAERLEPPPDELGDTDGYPAFLLQDPAVLAAEVLKSTASGEDGDDGSSNVRRMF